MLFIWTISSAQEHCVFRPSFVPTELYPTNPNLFEVYSHLHIDEDSISLNDESAAISNRALFPFSSKDELLRTMACIYHFPTAPENIEGEIIKYTLSTDLEGIGSQLTYIQYNDCGDQRYYVVTDFGLYQFSNRLFWIEEQLVLPEYFPLVRDTIRYIDIEHVDTTIEIVVLQEPIIEHITEIVLVKEAYTEIEVQEATFTQQEMYYTQEYSDCQDAQYDTTYLQILVKDAYNTLEVEPAVFETIWEQKQLRNEFDGGTAFERELFGPQLIVTQAERVVINTYEATDICAESYFYPCLLVNIDTIPAQDTITGNSYLPCPDGYTTAGKYCYNNEGVSPAIYETRSYEKLIAPAQIDILDIEAEYQTIEIITIVNKEDLEDNCIELRVDTFMFLVLESPATSVVIQHEAIYGDYIYEEWSGSSEFTVSQDTDEELLTEISIEYGDTYLTREIEVDQPLSAYWNVCVTTAIKNALLDKGLISNTSVSNQEYYQAIVDYQLQNDLLIGVIDNDLFISLEVELGY